MVRADDLKHPAETLTDDSRWALKELSIDICIYTCFFVKKKKKVSEIKKAILTLSDKLRRNISIRAFILEGKYKDCKLNWLCFVRVQK